MCGPLTDYDTNNPVKNHVEVFVGELERTWDRSNNEPCLRSQDLQAYLMFHMDGGWFGLLVFMVIMGAFPCTCMMVGGPTHMHVPTSGWLITHHACLGRCLACCTVNWYAASNDFSKSGFISL